MGRGVALRKESVDRNTAVAGGIAVVRMSLSARRAWIEIHALAGHLQPDASLSARRAWIEIDPAPRAQKVKPVALRKESVDRNS